MQDVQKVVDKNKIVTKVSYGIVLCLFLAVVMSTLWQTLQFYRTAHTLKSLEDRSVYKLRIYSRTTVARGNPITFSKPDILINDFISTLKDIRAYRGSPKGTISRDHEWLIELETTEGRIIQMSCHLPANRKRVVHGKLGQFDENGERAYYGDFQSQALFQWYQQYSYQWLGAKGQDEGTSVEMTK